MLFKDSNDKSNRRVPTVTMLMLRCVLGAYLIYLAKGVYDGAMEPENPMAIFLAFAVLFLAFGIVAIFMGAKDLLTGRYVGGAGDPAVMEELSEDAAAENSEKIIDVTDETVIESDNESNVRVDNN